MSNENKQIFVRQIYVNSKSWLQFLFTKKYIIIVFFLIGGILGFVKAYFKKVTYNSDINFVLSNGNNEAVGFSSIASQFGFDIGGGTNDVFSADNIISLFQSKKIVVRTLFQRPVNSNETLINIYAKEKKLDKDWKGVKRLENAYPFPEDPTKLTEVQDSLVREIHTDIINSVVSINRPDKKVAMFDVSTTFSNEIFAFYFTKYIVTESAKLYIETKTSLAKLNLDMLQHEADSLNALLSGSITSSLSGMDMTFNLNPAMQIQRANIQKSQLRMQVTQAAYTEVLKNLELAKLSLQKEYPIFQVIDEPTLPLKSIGQGKLLSAFIGSFIAAFLAILFIVVRKLFKDIL